MNLSPNFLYFLRDSKPEPELAKLLNELIPEALQSKRVLLNAKYYASGRIMLIDQNTRHSVTLAPYECGNWFLIEFVDGNRSVGYMGSCAPFGKCMEVINSFIKQVISERQKSLFD